MIDFEKIKLVYGLKQNLTMSDIEILFQSAKMKSFSSRKILIREGEMKKEIYFIRKGLVRSYYINEKGDEKTTSIVSENHFFSDPDATLFNRPSQFFYETLEPTDVFYMNSERLDNIISQNSKLEVNRKIIMEYILRKTRQHVHSFILHTPEERYIGFVKSNPNIIKRVPEKYIANILGITPVSLSRIKRRIATKKK